MLHMPGAQPRDEQVRDYPNCDPVIEAWTARFLDRLLDDNAQADELAA